MDVDALISQKNNLEEFAAGLTREYINFLIPLLSEKNDEIRYLAFLVLCERSHNHPDIYPYWDVFVSKLSSENSYQRTIGATLIAANIKWDKKKRFARILQTFMSLCNDEKFVTSRLTIQTIPVWAKYVPELLDKVVDELVHINVRRLKESQRKLILLDIINALIAIRELKPSEKITKYLIEAMTGGLLDKKSVKKLEPQINQT
ncbi:MAG: hypothetical protein GX936_07420 [Clostridiales bacterium]|jgi:hypothetical protein|nr:hypothetical protein [Clostridiales bacterium]